MIIRQNSVPIWPKQRSNLDDYRKRAFLCDFCCACRISPLMSPGNSLELIICNEFISDHCTKLLPKQKIFISLVYSRSSRLSVSSLTDTNEQPKSNCLPSVNNRKSKGNICAMIATSTVLSGSSSISPYSRTASTCTAILISSSNYIKEYTQIGLLPNEPAFTEKVEDGKNRPRLLKAVLQDVPATVEQADFCRFICALWNAFPITTGPEVRNQNEYATAKDVHRDIDKKNSYGVSLIYVQRTLRNIKKLPGTKTTLSLRSGKIMPLMCTTQFTLNLLSRYLELIKKANKQLINKYLGMLIGNF
ncbi:hypothetical protein GJ496_010773 [Pomphorhynchus laevis]|nr:hypothetical protein GJ496_010773 [Pomphorhynchus laevis]